MENRFLNLNRIEFFVTDACTSRCRHCSVYDGSNSKKARIENETATRAVYNICSMFDIKSIMTFGGEPLLFSDTTCSIHSAATKAGIKTRQLITNGYFSNNNSKIDDVVQNIKKSGINNILLSVDSFHDEFVPKEKVYLFIKELKEQGVEKLKLHPAWVVNRQSNNIYNKKTEECLQYFSDLEVPVSDGNNIFLSGRAAQFLIEYYDVKALDLNSDCGSNPYSGPLENVTSISINPNGDVKTCWFAIGNIYNEDIIDILRRYNPYEHRLMKHIKAGGIPKLIDYAKSKGVEIDLSKFYNTCEVCRYVACNI